MNTNEYLSKVLSLQRLADDSDEMEAMQRHRADVETLLRDHFDNCSPSIRYGGSKVKGTMIRESYDLDVICYFPHDDTGAGETLEDVYNNLRKALEANYLVDAKTSALRLRNPDRDCLGADFHIDVVPGRFTDDTKTDAFLYQASGEKRRLKTNIDVHIRHVRDSGVVDAIRLVKLWKVRNAIEIKHFVLELVVIELLKGRKTSTLAAQLEHVFAELRDHIDDVYVEDPANPTGNDLTPALNSARMALQSIARNTLALVESAGWEAVFGPTEDTTKAHTVEALRRVAAGVAIPSRPWGHDGS